MTTEPTAILIVSHGSVLCGAEQNLFAIAEKMRQRGVANVEIAFLNYTQPRFAESLERCIASGARRVRIIPYFLIRGKFMKEDLPPILDEARAKHPDITFTVAEPIGFHAHLADALESSARRARAPKEWLDSVADAAKFCRDSPKCPLHGTVRCPATAKEVQVVM